jgi:hypothetical protein
MLRAIRRFFDEHVAAPEAASTQEHRLAVAMAALLVEVMQLDGTGET